jgi:hypothetical protein
MPTHFIGLSDSTKWIGNHDVDKSPREVDRLQDSYGFVPELSAVDAVKRASDLRERNRWAVKTDITSFFDCIDRTRLRELLLMRVRHRSLHGLFHPPKTLLPGSKQVEARVAVA